jgi:transcriptional regulator with XRE-family HTH domain
MPYNPLGVSVTEYLDWQAISKRIKSLRNANKVSRERLSEIIGVSSSFINLLERGDSGVSVDNLFRLSRVFGVSVDYLLTGEQDGKIKAAPIKESRLNAVLGDCTDNEFEFAIGLITYLKGRVEVKK